MKCKDYQDQKKARKVKQADREIQRAIGQKVRPKKQLSDWIALDQQAMSRGGILGWCEMTHLDQAVSKYLVVPAFRIIIDICPPDKQSESVRCNFNCKECWNRELEVSNDN